MPEMAGMDRCKKAAQAESLTPEVSTARLCCALNCSQSGYHRLDRTSASADINKPSNSDSSISSPKK